MKLLRIALALATCGFATGALATGTYYNLGTTTTQSTTGGTGTSNGTSFANSSASQYCFNGASGCAVGGGTDYGNAFSYAGANLGSGPGLSITAWGTQSLSATGLLTKGWIGDYNANGLGITSQSTGELNGANAPDASSPNYQHAIDNVNAYEALLLSFGSKVTLNSIGIGFKGTDADATVLEYIGGGDPTGTLTGQSFSSLVSSGNWKLVNVFDMVANASGYTANNINQSGLTASKYWMVGSYLAGVGTNGADDGNKDSFKLSGFVVTPQAVPEPGSIALIGIAGLALAAGRRRARKA